MAKKKDAVKILDHITGDDRALRRTIAEDRLNLNIAQMIHDQRIAAGLTQAALARLVGTTQSVIARLEDADYGGHSVRMLHRVALALHGKLHVSIVGAPATSRKRQIVRRTTARKTGSR